MSPPPEEPGAESQKGAVALENALRMDRPTLGATTSLSLYRMVRLVAFEEMLGRAGVMRLSAVAGKRIGASLGVPDYASFIELFRDLGIGRVEIPSQGANEVYVDVYECAACCGLHPVGRTLCAFEGGLIAGVVQGIVQRRVKATEIACAGGQGDQACSYHLEFGSATTDDD